jgi:hypothetical protein
MVLKDQDSKRVMVLGVGAFTQLMMRRLRPVASVSAYLARDYAHWGPRQQGPARHRGLNRPNPCGTRRDATRPDVILPMSIRTGPAKPWTEEFLSLCSAWPAPRPTGEELRIERERDFARELFARCGNSVSPFRVRPHLRRGD